MPSLRALHVGEPIDPNDAKVGDVVSVEADDGSWGVWGEVDMVDPGDDEPFGLKLWGSQRWPTLLNATVRMVRPAPDPAEEEIHAIATVLHESGTEGFDARDLHARGMRVIDGGGQ